MNHAYIYIYIQTRTHWERECTREKQTMLSAKKQGKLRSNSLKKKAEKTFLSNSPLCVEISGLIIRLRPERERERWEIEERGNSVTGKWDLAVSEMRRRRLWLISHGHYPTWAGKLKDIACDRPFILYSFSLSLICPSISPFISLTPLLPFLFLFLFYLIPDYLKSIIIIIFLSSWLPFFSCFKYLNSTLQH